MAYIWVDQQDQDSIVELFKSANIKEVHLACKGDLSWSMIKLLEETAKAQDLKSTSTVHLLLVLYPRV